ncbi:hypothetical protein M2352_004801 [Azospirillum fermentarium]|nr:hypothetical protein [Azospirillum fermentarium]
MDHGGETLVRLASPHGNPLEFLEFLEEIFDEVTPFVFFDIVACGIEAFPLEAIPPPGRRASIRSRRCQ